MIEYPFVRYETMRVKNINSTQTLIFCAESTAIIDSIILSYNNKRLEAQNFEATVAFHRYIPKTEDFELTSYVVENFLIKQREVNELIPSSALTVKPGEVLRTASNHRINSYDVNISYRLISEQINEEWKKIVSLLISKARDMTSSFHDPRDKKYGF